MRKEFAWILGILLFVIFALLLGMYSINITHLKTKEELELYKDEIQELNREIGEYQAMDSFWEDYIDIIEDIYEGKINEAVLEERVKWLEKAKNENIPSNIYDDYVYQLLEDFDDAIEIIIYYYENTDQVVDLITYISTNYPALYARLLSYS